MNAVRFPDMFDSSGRTAVIYGKDATSQNLNCLLQSEKNTLFGDPYFGTDIQKRFHLSNNIILDNLIIDSIYDAVISFMPQLKISREDISVYSKDNKAAVNITAQNIVDFNFENYSLQLLNTEES